MVVADAFFSSRKIVGHRKHVYSRLQAVQIQLGMNQKRLQQDVSTCCNRTLYTLEGLLEQKQALATYAVDYDFPATLHVHQWKLIDNFIILLSLFEQLTKEVSSSEASAAGVIPSVRALRRLLSKDADTDHVVKTTKSAFLRARTIQFPAAGAEGETCSGESTHHPQCKRPRPDRAQPSLHDILEENEPERPGTTALQQLDVFLENPVPRAETTFGYWRNNHLRFPDLSQMARKCLCAPCTSTE